MNNHRRSRRVLQSATAAARYPWRAAATSGDAAPITPNQHAANVMLLHVMEAAKTLGISNEDVAAAMLRAFTGLVMGSPQRHEAADGLIRIALAMKSPTPEARN